MKDIKMDYYTFEKDADDVLRKISHIADVIGKDSIVPDNPLS